MTNPTQLDPVSVTIALTAFLLGSQSAAEATAPYAIIILSALVGAGFSTSGVKTESTWHSIGRLFGICGLACLGTVPVCMIIQHYTALDARWFFGLVAFLVGFRNSTIPSDITRSFRFMTALAASWLRWKLKDPQEPPR